MNKFYVFAILVLTANINCYYSNPTPNINSKQPNKEVSAQPDLGKIKEEIVSINKIRSKAASAIDLVTILEFYADDIILMQDSQATISGLTNVTSNSESWFDHQIGKSTVEYVTSEIFGDDAFLTEIGQIQHKDQFNKIYKTVFYMSVWKKHGDTWRCMREISNSGEPVT